MPRFPFPSDCATKFNGIRPIATGGYGAVYLAEQRNLGRLVAIKLLLSDMLKEPGQVQRFKNEAKVTAAVTHVNIIRILDYGAETGAPWIAYEYVEGRNLHEVVQSGGMTTADTVAATIQVARALEAAHARGVQHRDIKPENVLMTADGICKVTDFGIAQWGHPEAVRTQTGIVLGTAAYLAPELLRGERAAAGSDLYALGVMLFELVTGSLPYRHDSIAAVLQGHLMGEIPLASRRNERVPAVLDGFIVQALAKKAQDRHRTARVFRKQLEDILTQIEPTVGPVAGPSATVVLRPPARRQTVAVASRPRPRWTAVYLLPLGLFSLALFGGGQCVRSLRPLGTTATPIRSAPPAAASRSELDLKQIELQMTKLGEVAEHINWRIRRVIDNPIITVRPEEGSRSPERFWREAWDDQGVIDQIFQELSGALPDQFGDKVVGQLSTSVRAVLAKAATLRVILWEGTQRVPTIGRVFDPQSGALDATTEYDATGLPLLECHFVTLAAAIRDALRPGERLRPDLGLVLGDCVAIAQALHHARPQEVHQTRYQRCVERFLSRLGNLESPIGPDVQRLCASIWDYYFHKPHVGKTKRPGDLIREIDQLSARHAPRSCGWVEMVNMIKPATRAGHRNKPIRSTYLRYVSGGS
jgi:serine/threonine protein kinase